MTKGKFPAPGHLQQVLGLLSHRRQVDNHLFAEVGRRPGQGPGAELGKSVATPIGQHHVVPSLRTAAVTHDKVSREFPSEEVYGLPFPSSPNPSP